jgi:hypothetical protein
MSTCFTRVRLQLLDAALTAQSHTVTVTVTEIQADIWSTGLIS